MRDIISLCINILCDFPIHLKLIDLPVQIKVIDKLRSDLTPERCLQLTPMDLPNDEHAKVRDTIWVLGPQNCPHVDSRVRSEYLPNQGALGRVAGSY